MSAHHQTGETKTYSPPEAQTFKARMQEALQVDEKKVDEVLGKLMFYGLAGAGAAMTVLNILGSLR